MSQPLPSLRASHVLPTVKCSNCSRPVPLSALGDHVCQPQQPPPRQPKLYIPPSQPIPGPRSALPHTGQPKMYIPPPVQGPRSALPHTGQPKPKMYIPPPVEGPRSALPPTGLPKMYIPPPVQGPRSASTIPGHLPFPTIRTAPGPRAESPAGGESGMAGVGRRAFQAPPPNMFFNQHHDEPQGWTPGMGDQPQYLDIGAGRGTPPLSPNSTISYSSRSLSPQSYPSQSPPLNTPAFPMSPSSPPLPVSRARSNPGPPPSAEPAPHLPFFQQRYKKPFGVTSPVSPSDERRPFSPTDSDDPVGLPYDYNSSGESAELMGRLTLGRENSGASKLPPKSRDPFSQSPRRSHTAPIVSPRGAAGTPPMPFSSSAPGPGAVRSKSDVRHEKEHSSTRQRSCNRCERAITDGRWVHTDTRKGVLCEPCWKYIYLPKCRRCDKVIEKAAVFSSDGQLKGKYHRECFTCRVCRAPFPDKSFYVYDGHPVCAFHYHEANNSLCASRTCGKPIEGPCAVAEARDRFHPDCLRCEHAGCNERLQDFWEVNGMKLCERHARGGPDDEEERDSLGELAPMGSMPKGAFGQMRGQKRTTRLIDLSFAGGRI